MIKKQTPHRADHRYQIKPWVRSSRNIGFTTGNCTVQIVKNHKDPCQSMIIKS